MPRSAGPGLPRLPGLPRVPVFGSLARIARLPGRRRVDPAVSLVTGGASGIGLALASALVARGGRVVVADIDEAGVHRTAAGLGERASALTLDVTDAAAVADAVAGLVHAHGSLDLVANNAGIGVAGLAEELTAEHWDAALAVNLGGVVNGVRAAYPVMLEQGSGVILNTASLAGLMPVPGMLPYTTTKWGVVGLSLGLRAEAVLHGVQVNVLCPSFVDTPLLDGAHAAPPSVQGDLRGRIAKVQPRMLTADQTAAAALRGVDADSAVIAVGGLAQAGWRASRFSPEGLAWLGSVLMGRERAGS